jgi:IS30 family transposase
MTPRPLGHFLSESETEKIKRLLASTEMSIQDIATRMSCAKSTIVSINHKNNIRLYNGRRNNWDVTVYAQIPETPNS